MKRIFSILTLCLVALTPLMAHDGGTHGAADALSVIGVLLFGTAALTLFTRSFGLKLMLFGLMATTIDASDLRAAYGTEYRAGKSLRDLRSLLYQSAEMDQLFTVDYIRETVWERGYSSMGPILQRFQLAFTPSGGLNLQPSPIPLYDVKADIKTSSHEIKRDWGIGSSHRNDSVPQMGQEFFRWLVNEHLSPRWVQDVENAAWDGVLQPVVSNVAGTASGSMNGLKYIINDHITNGRITPIAMGAPPAFSSTNAAVEYVNYLEAMVEELPVQLLKENMELVISYSRMRLFREGMRLKYHLYYDSKVDAESLHNHPKIKVVGAAAMGNSDKVWMTFKKNRIKAVNLKDNPEWMFEGEDRSLKIWKDTMIGYGFWVPEYVFTNDVELTNGSSN